MLSTYIKLIFKKKILIDVWRFGWVYLRYATPCEKCISLLRFVYKIVYVCVSPHSFEYTPVTSLTLASITERHNDRSAERVHSSCESDVT
jgi:hypothetical protein